LARKTISDEAFLDNALEMFRSRGYDGVSVSELSAASGLEKASVFYRFPGGKAEVALAVVARVNDWFDAHVFAPLRTAQSPHQRVRIAASGLRTFYRNGTRPCITDVLSLEGGAGELAAALRAGLEGWLRAFAEIARESGMPRALARARAEEAVTRIQGSLVLSRVLGDTQPFLRVTRALPELLTRKSNR
jgi:TetR/AcrR family transcriptional regulator, lmrAB and yxaGH operons repressor